MLKLEGKREKKNPKLKSLRGGRKDTAKLHLFELNTSYFLVRVLLLYFACQQSLLRRKSFTNKHIIKTSRKIIKYITTSFYGTLCMVDK
jgi:hypothetical protein